MVKLGYCVFPDRTFGYFPTGEHQFEFCGFKTDILADNAFINCFVFGLYREVYFCSGLVQWMKFYASIVNRTCEEL